MTPPVLLSLPWGDPRVLGFTSTRQGGTSLGAYDSLNLGLNTEDAASSVLENRRLAMEAQGLETEAVVYLQQVHGDRILEATAQDRGRGGLDWSHALPACDAAFTREQGLPLAVGHADCLAVALADANAGIVGVAHAGWRGALAALPAQLARRMIQEGALAKNLEAVLSPCLGPDHLELAEEQHRLFAQKFSDHADFCSNLKQGHFYLDLWGCARKQLEALGIQGNRIHVQQMDTAAHPELFYSHRRDQGKTGRMMTLVSLP